MKIGAVIFGIGAALGLGYLITRSASGESEPPPGDDSGPPPGEQVIGMDVNVVITDYEITVRPTAAPYRGFIFTTLITNPNSYPVNKTITVWKQKWDVETGWSSKYSSNVSQSLTLAPGAEQTVVFDGERHGTYVYEGDYVVYWFVDEVGHSTLGYNPPYYIALDGDGNVVQLVNF